MSDVQSKMVNKNKKLHASKKKKPWFVAEKEL